MLYITVNIVIVRIKKKTISISVYDMKFKIKGIIMGILTYFIEVERIISWYGAIEPRFQETRPSVTKSVGPTFIVLAYSTDT